MPDLAIKTVLELDLVSYGDIARALEEQLDAHAVKALQEQIQDLIDQALGELGLRREDVVTATAGDGAILVFDEAAQMHRFSAAVSGVTSRHNECRAASARRWFRMGAATGPMSIGARRTEAVGIATTRAVRLETASEPGSLLVDVPTFEALPENLRAGYGPELVVTGKRSERFPARRRVFVEVSEESEPRGDASMPAILHELWDRLDGELQDAFALAYNKKRRERSERPVRISTRDLFQALTRINDGSLRELLSSIPADALPEPSDAVLTNERALLDEDHLLSDCVADSLGAFRSVLTDRTKLTPADLFVDISKHGHGASVEQLRNHGIGPAQIESRIRSLGLDVLEPRG